MISDLDVALVVGVLLLIALSLLGVGRRHRISGLVGRGRGRSRRSRRAGAAIRRPTAGRRGCRGPVVRARPRGGARRCDLRSRRSAAVSRPHCSTRPRVAPRGDCGTSAHSPIPVLAYYYIWFNPTSWKRAKIDYPLLGRYSSDDEVVMAEHVRMAQEAGHRRVPGLLEAHAAAEQAAGGAGGGRQADGLPPGDRLPGPGLRPRARYRSTRWPRTSTWLADHLRTPLDVPLHRRAARGRLDRHRALLHRRRSPGSQSR